MTNDSQIRRDLGDRMKVWRDRPSIMVRELFQVVPDRWQEEALDAFPHTPRMAMKACKGPGKTTVLSWIAWNFMVTREFPNIAATSISGPNLADGLWKEMAKWMERSYGHFLKERFDWTRTRITAKEHPETWFMSARTWAQSADAEQQAHTLAGFHADYVLFLIDESGGCPDALMPTAEAAFAGTKECHIVQAGNPTMLSGPLYRACTVARHLWRVIEITGDPDAPNRSPRIPIEYAREQIQQYGRDDPWVLINIFGQFPPSSLNALIGPDEVMKSQKLYYREHEIGRSAKVMGVDVAREGDDQSVICRRQGLQMFPLSKYRNIDSTQGAGQVARLWADWGADAAFIDATGGFGSGWIDQLYNLKRAPIGVQFSGKAHNPSRFYNKRTEMYFDLVAWIKRGGALADDPKLLAALTQTTYCFKKDLLLLEPKDQVKVKLGYSPDEGDAAALTFAEPITVQDQVRRPLPPPTVYQPFRELDSLSPKPYGEYDPFRG